jgi:hypothetical protein
MNTLVNEAADIITGTYGRLTITYRRLTYTWTVTVYSGTLRIDELCDAYDSKNAAWREAQRIALAAHQGKTVRQIEAEKPSELTLAEAKRIIDGVNANMDAAQPKPVDVSDIVPQGAGSWQALRRSHTRKANVTTDAMDRILASADAGYIARSGQATSRQLIALKDRGLVELDWQWTGRERSIAGAWLAGHKPQEVAA